MAKKAATKIPEPNFNNQKIKFSFEHYDTSRSDYCISKWSEGQIRLSLQRLKEISGKSFDELRRDRRVNSFSEVVWEKTIEKQGFPDGARNLSPFHFALLSVNGQRARVYGAYSSGTFYIVWFDLNHVIWPTPLRNT